MQKSIRISVIIPTFNRKESLLQTLDSLKSQTYPTNNFEVILVDDGSNDETHLIVEGDFPYSLQYIHQANQGSAVARNTGAYNARGDLLIFVDDDILAEPDYISGLSAEHDDYETIIGMGTFLPYLPENPTTFAKIWIGSNTNTDDDQSGEFVDFTACVTNNLSVRKDDFYEIGGMQDVAGDGPTWWGDVDFGFRAHQLGFRFLQSEKARCTHCDYSYSSLQIACERADNVSKMAHALEAKHPGILDYLPMFTDKSVVSWGQDSPKLITRKLARKISSSQPGVRSMEFIVNLLETHSPNPSLLRPLYRWVIGAYIYRGYRQGLKEYGNLDTLP